MGSDGRIPDHALTPADTRANQKPVLSRRYSITLQNSAEPFRCHSGGVIQHFSEARLQGQDTKFGKQFLLANAQMERAAGQVV